jgi:hypothetical protein
MSSPGTGPPVRTTGVCTQAALWNRRQTQAATDDRPFDTDHRRHGRHGASAQITESAASEGRATGHGTQLFAMRQNATHRARTTCRLCSLTRMASRMVEMRADRLLGRRSPPASRPADYGSSRPPSATSRSTRDNSSLSTADAPYLTMYFSHWAIGCADDHAGDSARL